MKKTISLLLAFMFLFIAFTACSQKKELGNTAAGTTDEATVSTSEETPAYKLEPQDLGGYDFVVNTRGQETGNESYYVADFYSASLSAATIPDAVFTRNQTIMRDFNVTITQIISAADQADQIRMVHMAGSKTYEAAIVLASAAAALAVEGILYDLKQFEAIHFDEPYWDQNAVSDLALGGRLYFVSGDSNISTLESAAATFFNVSLIKDYELENPYTLVKEGKWTLEKLSQMAAQVANDYDGDGMDLSIDLAGHFTYYSSGIYFFYALGERISTNSDDGYPEITVLSSQATYVVEDIYQFLNPRANPVAIVSRGNDRSTMFRAGRVLFTEALMWDLRNAYRKMNVQYGVIPIPKYDEDQASYGSVVYFQDCVHLWTIPRTGKDTDKASIMLEAFAAYSTDTTMNAYYYQVLSYQSTKDPDSLQMLETIRGCLIYDLAVLYNWGNFRSFFTGLAQANGNNFSTVYTSNIEAANSSMNEVLDKFREFSGS